MPPERVHYISNRTTIGDLKIIIIGLWETIFGAINKRQIRKNYSQIAIFLLDLVLVQVSYISAYLIYLKKSAVSGPIEEFILCLTAVIVVRLFCNVLFGVYHTIIPLISYHEIMQILKAITVGSGLLVGIAFLLNFKTYPIEIAIIDTIFLISFQVSLRYGLKTYLKKKMNKADPKKKNRVLIFGANEIGRMAYKSLVSDKLNHTEVIGFIDDATRKYGKTINGIKVIGNRFHINTLLQIHSITELIIAEPDAKAGDLNELIKICQSSGVRYRIFAPISNSMFKGNYITPPRFAELSDLLEDRKTHIDYSSIEKIISGRIVLLNGSGGELGLELCQKILESGCKKLVIIDRYESYLAELVTSLYSNFQVDRIVPILINNEKINSLEIVFEDYRPEIIFHAGMRKFAPVMRAELDDVVGSNYVRTFNLARVTEKYKCKNFVLISSVASRNGGNFIAESLYVAELALKHFFGETKTRLSVVRFCNIVENRGGIVSHIDHQIRKQNTVTFPAENAKTYLISKKRAVEIILQTLADSIEMNNGDGKFVSEPGTSVSFIEVAGKIANLYGLELGINVVVKFNSLLGPQADLKPDNTSNLILDYPPDINLQPEDIFLNSEKIKLKFKQFVYSNYVNLSVPELTKQTQELISLCKSSIVMSN